MLKSFPYIFAMVLTIQTVFFPPVFVATGPLDLSPNRETDPSLKGATSWLNTRALNLAELRGKVVLIDFWTYTCINWRRTLPYIREWESKYKAQGLVVIGVHTPEFSFEHKLENVKNANKEMNINYPVAVDSNYEIWQSFQNEYWPALYLIDGNGKLRYQKFGEGDYLESELMIQKLLKEASASNVPTETVSLQPGGFEAAADWRNLKSPESYVGYGSTQGFASPGGIIADKQLFYTTPANLKLNQWALSGEWTIEKERIRLNGKQGKIIYRFHARDINLIMGPGVKASALKFRVLIDGNLPGKAHGLDIDVNGNGTVTESRMYQLIRQQGPITEHEFQIEFLAPKVEVYDFTFG
jgi:thiol-disulfide isomerase/thioredoxin